MTKKPADRLTISLPSDAEVTREEIEALAEDSEAESISEWVRRQISRGVDESDS